MVLGELCTGIGISRLAGSRDVVEQEQFTGGLGCSMLDRGYLVVLRATIRVRPRSGEKVNRGSESDPFASSSCCALRLHLLLTLSQLF